MRAELPVAFGDFFAGLVEQRYSPGPADAFHRCFGCGPAHPSGLPGRVFEAEDGVVSPVVVPRVYEGPPGAAHDDEILDVEGSLEEFGAARVVATARGRCFPFATAGATRGSEAS